MQKSLEIKNKQIQELEDKVVNLRYVVQKITTLEKNDIIYIATTEQYKKSNFLIVGGTTKSNFNKRLAGYKTGRHPDDQYFYSWILSMTWPLIN